jgi:CheY-like chemotaxis protein
MMPVMNGWEFVEEINKDIMLSSIPIVVVTAIGDAKKSPESADYIPKPINLNALMGAICKHCGADGSTSCTIN